MATAAICLAALSPSATFATEARDLIKPITTRLNTTGRALDVPVPLKEGRRELGEIIIRLNPDDSVLVHRSSFLQHLQQSLNDETRQRIANIEASFITLEQLVAAGIQVRFDPALQELIIKPTADQRPVGELHLGGRGRATSSARLSEPARVSGYVNVIGSLDWVWGNKSSSEGLYNSDGHAIGRIDIDSAIRLGGVVLENRAVYKSAYEAFLCPDPTDCSLGVEQGFHRQSSRAVYDMPAHGLRLIGGDHDPLGIGFQGMPEFIGFSIEKAPAKFGDAASLRPSPKSTFRIERPSDVEIRINRVTYYRAQLQPGTYNVRDFPIASGANEIELRITDASGVTETQRLSAYYDTRLLREGTSEWAVLGGLPSAFFGEERIYSDRGLFASGFIRWGWSDGLTIEAHAQTDSDVAMGGAGVIAQTPWGIAAIRGAASYDKEYWGVALGFDWSAINFRGPFDMPGHSFRVSGEFRTEDFDVPGSVITHDDTTITRPVGYRARLDAFYSFPLTESINATIAARYVMQPSFNYLSGALPYGGNAYGVDVTVTSPLTAISNLALTVGYAKEPRWSDVLKGDGVEGEFRAIVRVNIRPDSHLNVSSSYDTAHQTAQLSAYQHGDSALGRWHVSVNAQHDGQADIASASGSANLTTGRTELTVAHSATSVDGLYFGLDGRPSQQRTSLRAGSSIAFADGVVAIGAPIRNGAFAIVHGHESIAGKEIVVGDPERPRARADWLGPALVNDLPAYHPASFAVDVADLPIGYSLGAAAFDVNAPYKAGYRLEVGSAYAVYAHGTLLLDSGEPVAFLSGMARTERDPSREVPVFTNAAGRFGAEGLAPGRWVIELATDGRPTLYEINVPPSAEGLFDAGTLRPVRTP